MSGLCFSLLPFPSSALPKHMSITGGIERRSNLLSITYVLVGSLRELSIPAHSDTLARKDGLWEETCLEFFLGQKGSDRYWEFNLSPSGHWNVYSFLSYRQGMKEEPAYASLPFNIQLQQGTLSLSLELDLEKIIPADSGINIAVSAVIKASNGEVSYWALTHTGPKADFHRRDSFIVEM